MEWSEVQGYDDECKKQRKDMFYNFLWGLIFVGVFFLGVRLINASVRYDAVRTQIETATERQDYGTLESLEEPPWSFVQCFWFDIAGIILAVTGAVLATAQFGIFLPGRVRRYRDAVKYYELVLERWQEDEQDRMRADLEYRETQFEEEQREQRILEKLKQFVIVDGVVYDGEGSSWSALPEDEVVDEKVHAVIERLQKFNNIQSNQRQLIAQYNATYLAGTEDVLGRMKSRLYDKIEIVLFRHERAPSEYDEFLSMLSELPSMIDKELDMAEELYNQSVAMAELSMSSRHDSDEAQIAAWTETLKEEVAKRMAAKAT